MKVFYINHAGTFGGATRSLLEVLNNFKNEDIEVLIASPRGSATGVFRKLNFSYIPIRGISLFDHTNIGYYRGFRWLILLREFIYIFPTVWFFITHRKTIRQYDIVHINETTLVLPLIITKTFFKKPVVLHARTPFYNNPRKLRTRWLTKVLNKYPDKIIAIDQTVAKSLEAVNNVEVIHNGFSIDNRFQGVDRSLSEKLSRIKRRRINLGFLGAITPIKGIFELLEAVKSAAGEGMDVNLVIVGNGNPIRRTFVNNILKAMGLTYDGNEFLRNFIKDNHLEEYIHPLGFTTNTKEFFEYIDVICFPSYFNAVGRPVFEAAFFRKPAIVAIKDPLPDTFIGEVTGLRVEVKDPASILTAIRRFYYEPDSLVTMGEGAYELANANFDIKINSKRVVELYKKLLFSKR